MDILLGNNHLQKTGGTENYTYALAIELKRKGYDVEYFAFERGDVSALLEREGIPYMTKKKYDLILANHISVVEHLHTMGYIIQTCHGVIPDMEQPSKYADRHVSVSDEIKQHLKDCGFDSTIILNGIDCIRFSPKKPISRKLTTVLSLCQSDQINAFLRECCEAEGIRFFCSNKHTDNVWKIEDMINESDMVVGIGRSIYDAMACGRCVISYDNRGYMNEALGDGYLTSENISDSIKRNCSGRSLRRKFDKKAFVAELAKYNPADGAWAREYAIEYLNVAHAADEYLNLYFSYKMQNFSEVISRIKKIRRSASIWWRNFKQRRKNRNLV